ncbi:MAG: transglycosylase SLT domain-containing protein [Deltaproteobacteria bacterium]|nr:transglycosylase SLT domain-containing protein [Deltaproteobacteria bacterium]
MYSRQYGVDPCLVAAVIIVESNGVVTAVSDKGAVGLMQVMPYMARDMGFEGDLFDIEDNIRIGVFILANNIRMWGRSEGIQRYFWGNMPISDGRYIAKVEKALQEINALGSTGANAG